MNIFFFFLAFYRVVFIDTSIRLHANISSAMCNQIRDKNRRRRIYLFVIVFFFLIAFHSELSSSLHGFISYGPFLRAIASNGEVYEKKNDEDEDEEKMEVLTRRIKMKCSD